MAKPLALPVLQIASPCPASWAEMAGDEQARHCAACDKKVYNIATMTSAEVVALIELTEGHFCGRLFRRADGTVLTADCPVGLATRAARRVKRLVGLAGVAIGVLLTGGFQRGAVSRTAPGPSQEPKGPPASLAEWISGTRKAAPVLRPPVLGKICLPPQIPSPTPGLPPKGGQETISAEEY